MALLPHNKSPLQQSGAFFCPYSVTYPKPISRIEKAIIHNEKSQIFVWNSGIFRELVLDFWVIVKIFILLFKSTSFPKRNPWFYRAFEFFSPSSPVSRTKNREITFVVSLFFMSKYTRDLSPRGFERKKRYSISFLARRGWRVPKFEEFGSPSGQYASNREQTVKSRLSHQI